MPGVAFVRLRRTTWLVKVIQVGNPAQNDSAAGWPAEMILVSAAIFDGGADLVLGRVSGYLNQIRTCERIRGAQKTLQR